MAHFLSVRLHVRRLFSSNLPTTALHRALALSLCCLFIFSSMTPTVSAATDMLTADKTGALPSALETVKPAYAAAQDATTGSAAAGPGLQTTGVATPKTYKKEELPSKRTATSDVTRNTNGTLTTREYTTPHYFKADKDWKKIDTTLVEDKNAADATNPLSKAWGVASSAFKNETTFTVKDNDWQARFAPSDFADGMVRIKSDKGQFGFSPVGAKKVAPVITASKQDGKQLVNYYDLWPGVNLQYVVDGSSVKENIILKNSTADTTFAFKIIGADLESRTAKDGPAFGLKGQLKDSFSLSHVNLILNNFGFVTDKKSNLTQTYDKGTLTVSVSKKYIATLPAKAFPAVIDPAVTKQSSFGTRAGGSYISFKSDGYICYSNECNLYAGSLVDSNGYWQTWRGVFHAPYQDYLKGRKLDNATFHIKQRSNESFWTGTGENRWFYASHTTCNDYNCSEGGTEAAGLVGSEGNIDMTSTYQKMMDRNDWGAWMALRGEEWTGATTFKNIDPEGSFVSFTYHDILPSPSILTPQQDQVYTDPQVSFRSSTHTNPRNGESLKYQFCVSSGGGCNGAVMVSGIETSSQWTIPDGILQDGTTYYVQAQSYDSSTDVYSGYGPAVTFKIDARTGKDKTQTFDSLGPVDVDLATGNVATSNSSHTTSALGGSLGVSLDYNTPAKSRGGLVGEYYNNTDQSGAPALTRVDQQIDFSWQLGSPATNVINNDNFSARWTGYFVAPKAGDYFFGGTHDDSASVTVNNQLLYTAQGWRDTPGYGSSIYLNAGQIVPIRVTTADVGGAGYMRLYIKGAVGEQIVPNTWLQTGVRATGQAQGLTGRYYKDNGTHDFKDSANTLFMQRNDPLLSFSWESGSAAPGGPTDNFMARWTGYVTVPKTGNYKFGSVSDDGTRITVGTNNTLAFDKWRDDGNTELYGNEVMLIAGQSVPIAVEYFEHGGGASMFLKLQSDTLGIAPQVIPSAWLSPKAQVLPDGWSLGIDPDGNLGYDHLKVNQNSVVLSDSTGSTHEYTWTGSAYKAPVNEDGKLTKNNDGSFNLQDVDGRTYVFDNQGVLTGVTTPTNDRKPAALKYDYSGTPAKLKQISDGVDPGRFAKIYYSGDTDCGTTPSGFEATPANMLCAVKTNDGRATYFYYLSGKLSRILKPGNEAVDYQYDTAGRITAIRDSLANDAVAAGIRVNDANILTQISYDAIGRAKTVTQPAATAGATRTVHSVDYIPGNPRGLVGQYYSLAAGEGFTIPSRTADAAVIDQAVDFNWGMNAPAGIQADRFVARWTGYVTVPTAGSYNFCVTSDDGMRLSLGGAAYAEAWVDRGPAQTCGPAVALTAGQSKAVTLDYYENWGSANVTFQVQQNGQAAQTVPAAWLSAYTPTASGYYGASLQHISNSSEPNDFSRRVEYDNLLRTTRDTDVANLSTVTEWDPVKDLTYSTTDPTGLKSTTIYDDDDRPVDQYGPAPAAWFGTDRKPLAAYTSQVPRTSTGYDEGISGLAVAYYAYGVDSKSLLGAPKLHSTGLAGATGTDANAFNKYYGTTSPVPGQTDNWGLRATGKMRLPVTGTYTFRLWSDNGMRLYIDDQLQMSDWNDNAQHNHPIFTYSNVAGSVHRITIEYYHRNGDANMTMYITPPGGTEQWQNINAWFKPDYDLQTSSKTYDSVLGDISTTTNYGSNPELGLAQSTNLDPTGLNYSSSSTYEAAGATGSFLRQTSKTLPGGTTTNYAYYGATDVMDNPCTTGVVEAYRQGGQIRLKSEADPDKNAATTTAGINAPRTTETIYDDSGKIVATRMNADAWTCSTYDSRERVATTVIPAQTVATITPNTNTAGTAVSRPGRTITNNYAVAGNPLVTSSTDSTGTISTTVDLLGRTTSYIDAKGNTTTTSYDASGKISGRTSPLGVEAFVYDSYDRLVDQKLDGLIYAHVTYDAYGQITTVTYPQAGAQKLTITRDVSGRISKQAYTLGNGATGPSDQVTRSVNGDILSGTENGIAKAYTYDKAGRLTSANLGTTKYDYDFTTPTSTQCAQAGVNLNSHKNSNRTKMTVTSGVGTATPTAVATTYCYDQADRLLSSSDATVSAPMYDAHGNTIQLGTAASKTQFTYDSSDRNSGITEAIGTNVKTLTYSRDVQGRITSRTSSLNSTVQSDILYGFTASGDTPDFAKNTSGVVTEKYLQLPGNVLVTIRPSATPAAAQKTYSLPNIHGDVFATTDAAGTLLNTTLAGPFGEKISGQTVPGNALTGTTYGYVGQHEKLTESGLALQPVQMGERIYVSSTGRFLQVDPVEGGGANNYSYPPDSVNDFDLDGRMYRTYSLGASAGLAVSAGITFDGHNTYLSFGIGIGLPGGGLSVMSGPGRGSSGWSTNAGGAYGIGAGWSRSKNSKRVPEAGLGGKGLAVIRQRSICLTCNMTRPQPRPLPKKNVDLRNYNQMIKTSYNYKQYWSYNQKMRRK